MTTRNASRVLHLARPQPRAAFGSLQPRREPQSSYGSAEGPRNLRRRKQARAGGAGEARTDPAWDDAAMH